MTVRELIEWLTTMPQDAEVSAYSEGKVHLKLVSSPPDRIVYRDPSYLPWEELDKEEED